MAAWTLDRLIHVSREKEAAFMTHQDAEECLREAVLHSNFRADLLRHVGFGVPGSYVVAEATAKPPTLRARSLPSRLTPRFVHPAPSVPAPAAAADWTATALAVASDAEPELELELGDQSVSVDDFASLTEEMDAELSGAMAEDTMAEDTADVSSDSGSDDYETACYAPAVLEDDVDRVELVSRPDRKRPLVVDDTEDVDVAGLHDAYASVSDGCGARVKRQRTQVADLAFLVISLSA